MAIKNAVVEVSKTNKYIDSVYVKDFKDFKVRMNDHKITSYGVIGNVSFRVRDKMPSSKLSKNKNFRFPSRGWRGRQPRDPQWPTSPPATFTIVRNPENHF